MQIFILTKIDIRFNRFARDAADTSDKLKESVNNAFNNFRNEQQTGFDRVENRFAQSMAAAQASTDRKLDDIKAVVSEKLEKTLETRLAKSFFTVTEQLARVNQGLGEMKTVAESVGSLNRILARPQSRGYLGELQLGAIIEDMLPPQMYEKQAVVRKGSAERVDYAVKMPGADDGEYVYLPIDSKFPMDDYNRMQQGYEAGDNTVIEASRKALMNRIKAFAKDVSQKYVSPPKTTNFAVIFLPTEGLYAEIIRDCSAFDELNRIGVVIAGPNSLSAMLGSLQVGFKTLQIQKNVANIEKTLGSVKKEFNTFGELLGKTQLKIRQAGDELEDLIGVRTRAINRSLKDIQLYEGIGEGDYISDGGEG
jgi:DNA recombination protein RmuC